MASVHLGRLLGPVGFSKIVAIKRLHSQFAEDPEFLAMFIEEARLASAISHPNVVQVFATGSFDDRPYIAMELYAPGTWHGTCLSLSANMLAAHSSPTTIHGYARRQPETTVLYGVVHDHLATLLDHARDRSEHGFGYLCTTRG